MTILRATLSHYELRKTSICANYPEYDHGRKNLNHTSRREKGQKNRQEKVRHSERRNN
jgi:hypothetical protein